jgi:prepilin-type processing-associated H-X9-DG protein
MYAQDYDETFPTAWGGVAWSIALEPYQKVGVASDGSNWDTQKGLLHCPDDSATDSTRYALNAFLSGIGGLWASQSGGTQVGYQQSATLSAINAPADVVWAFETTHRWLGGVEGDPPTDSPRCMVAGDGVDPGWIYDVAQPCSEDSTVVIYKNWMKMYDETDFTGDFWPYGEAGNTCTDGNVVCSKYPAFRHSRSGLKTGSANMVFSDGHAKAVRWEHWISPTGTPT